MALLTVILKYIFFNRSPKISCFRTQAISKSSTSERLKFQSVPWFPTPSNKRSKTWNKNQRRINNLRHSNIKTRSSLQRKNKGGRRLLARASNFCINLVTYRRNWLRKITVLRRLICGRSGVLFISCIISSHPSRIITNSQSMKRSKNAKLSFLKTKISLKTQSISSNNS